MMHFRCAIESVESRVLMSTVNPVAEFAAGPGGDYWGASGRNVAADAAGNFVVAVSGNGFDNVNAYARVFDRDGNLKAGPMLVDDPADSRTKFTPNVAMAANGRFVVTWYQTDNVIGARLFDAAGQPQGPVIQVQKPANVAHGLPAAAMDDDGDFVIVWQGYKRSSFDIIGQRYSAAGVPVGQQFTANATIKGTQSSASVDMDGAGNFMVAWESSGQDGSGSGVYGQRFGADGAKVGREFRVNGTTAGDQKRPMVALDADGDAVVVWAGPAADATAGMWGRRYPAAGAPAGDEFRINGPAAGDVVAPAVDMDRGGAFVATWSQYAAGSSTNQGRAYDGAGAPVGGTFVVSSTRNPSYSQVAVQSAHEFVVIGGRDDWPEMFGQKYIVL